MRQFTSLAQTVGDCAADAQSGRDFLDREKRFAREVGCLRIVAGDTGATSLASQVVASSGLGSLACHSPFRISSACNAVRDRLTRGKLPEGSSGPGGRRFKSCLPDQHVSGWIRFILVWSGFGFFLACAIAAQERFSLRFKGLQASPAHLAPSQRVVGSCLT